MKTRLWLFLLALLVLPAGMPPLLQAADQPAGDPGWPRTFMQDGKELTIYQPQIDSWENYKKLHVRFAIAVKPAKAKKETFGVAEIEADTVVDQATRVVAVIPKKRDLRFPNTTDAEADALRRTVEELHPPSQGLTLSLDRVLAYLNPDQQQLQHAVQLNLDPPKIYHSSKPAILVMIMGQPQLKPVLKDKNDLMFVANTNWDILYDVAGQSYYLLNRDGWLTTKDLLKGPWSPAANLPPLLSTLPNDDNWGDVRQNVPGKPVKEMPEVLVSTGPAELILTQGDPTYRPIAETKLMQLTNTDAVVFLNSGDAQYYFLTAGRWFRSASLDGPWAIASNDLPQDFAKIPENDPAAFVKASVPGTTDAKDAVLLASIPTTKSVDANSQPKLQVAYDGQPNFQPIPSTTVQYATNTSNAVFLVNGAYYCCDGGVWYTANSPSGPWRYCTNVPAAIYTIPPSHPAYNVTYVTVQDSTPSTVVYSQTAGYSGEYVAATGVLMFGAGMIAGALLEDHWDDDYYHYPVPYSYGWGASYNYAYGGYYRPPYANYYGPYRGAGFATAYNPVTGTYARGGYAYGPAGAASWGRAYNPTTGARAAGARVDTFYGSAGRFAGYNPTTGTAARGGYRSNAYGAVAGVQTNRGTGALAWNTAHGEGAVVKGRDGNVYAGRDGNVYHRDSNGNWSTNSGNGWQSVNRPEPRSAVQQRTQQRADTVQARRSQVQSRTAGRQDWPRVQQPSANRQFGTRTRELDSQAFARSRGNQLSERRSSFAAQMQNRPSRGAQLSQPRWQGQQRAIGGGGSGRAIGSGRGGHGGGGLRR
ncbi:hypothetical protein [Desulfobulbus sp.]|uniref:hypothetical protein n=1 Tax=Desulfobulbus sp. TaxID=895 RepID=UPI00286F7012|nr:hypothetical protein [Desulfobulbus sp.]